MPNQPYVYFIHYTRPDGTGSTSLNLPRPIQSFTDIQLIAQYLRQICGYQDAVIANYQLMSSPDTCTTCGR